MWIVEVIEKGTGKLLAEDYGRDRSKIETSYKKFQKKYPDASVIMEYMSQNVSRYCQSKRKKG